MGAFSGFTGPRGFTAFSGTRTGGGGEPAPVDLSDNFTDTFTGVADNTTLRSLPGWAAYNSAGSTDFRRDRPIIVGQQIQMNGSIGSGGTDFLVAHELDARGLEGAYFRFTIGTGWPGTSMAIAIASTDQLNVNYITLTSSIITVLKTTPTAARTQVVQATGRTFAAGDVIEMFMTKDMRLTVARNGVIEPSVNARDMNSVGGGTALLGQRSGFLTDGNFVASGLRADNVYISSRAGNVTVANAAPFYPSEFINLGYESSDYIGRTIPVVGTYLASGTVPTGMQVAVVDELNSATVYQDYTNVTNFYAADGAWIGDLRVNATPQTGRLAPRFLNDTSITCYATTTIACGPTWMGYGQSNAAFALGVASADTSVNPYRNRNTYSFNRTLDQVTANVWTRNDNSMSSQVLARVLSDAFGLTVGVCGGGIGSQPASALRKTAPTGGPFTDPYNGGIPATPYQLLTNHLVAAGAVGCIAGIFYDQGEAEGDATGSNISTADYTTNVSGIFADLRADFAGGRNVLGLMTITGRSTATVGANQNANWSAVRATQKALTATIPNCIIGHHNVGILMSDTVHYAGAVNGKTEKHRRNGRSIVFATLGTGYGGSGPETLTASRSGAVITIPITANGATSYEVLSGLDGTTAGNASALTSWEVSADDFATTLTISSAVLSGTNIVITLSADPGGPVKVRNHWGKNPTITSVPFAVYPDGFKIAVEPLVIPLTAA